jgi:hypothetical protein
MPNRALRQAHDTHLLALLHHFDRLLDLHHSHASLEIQPCGCGPLFMCTGQICMTTHLGIVLHYEEN